MKTFMTTISRQSKSWRTPSSANLVTPNHKQSTRPSQIRGQSISRQWSCARAQTGSFALNAADGQPRVGMADYIANLLCHFIGKRISHFWKCDVKHKIIKQNTSILSTWIPGIVDIVYWTPGIHCVGRKKFQTLGLCCRWTSLTVVKFGWHSAATYSYLCANLDENLFIRS